MNSASINLRAEAAREYREGRRRPTAQKKSHQPATEVEQEERRRFIFDELFEAIRYATGALVAIGAGDYDMAQSALGNFVAATRLAVRAWDAHEAARKAEPSNSEGHAA